MFETIEGLPADVLAIEASGHITHQDYRDTLIPMAERLFRLAQLSAAKDWIATSPPSASH